MLARIRLANVSHSSGRRMKADQSHVVGQRHPGEADVIRRELCRFDHAACVGDDVAVRQHHAFRLAGRAGGELDERDIVRPRLIGLPRTRDVVQVIDQEGARAQARESSLLAGLGGESTDPLERAALGVDEGLAELARDAQELVTVLVADTEGDRHGHYPAEHRGPERIDELLVAAEKEDQLVAAARPEALQVMEDAERARIQLLVTDVAGVMLALEVSDLPGMVAVGRDELGQGSGVRRGIRHQRRSSLMCRG